MSKHNVYYKLIRRIMRNGGSIGALSSDVHTSILKYVSGYSKGVSIIDMTLTIKSIVSFMNAVRLCLIRDRTIIIVANSKEHQRLASHIFSTLPKNVIRLTTRWNPGIFSNYERFRDTISVFNRKAAFNKTPTVVRRYYDTYGDIEDMYAKHKVPQLVLFIQMANHEDALTETRNHGIPTAGIVNTDYDDSKGELHYKIPLGDNIAISTLFMLILREVIQLAQKPMRPKKNSVKKVQSGVDKSIITKYSKHWKKRQRGFIQDRRLSKRMQLAKRKWNRRKPFVSKARRLNLYRSYIASKK